MASRGDSQDFIAKLLRRRDKTEGLSWLRGQSPTVYRNIGELTNADSIAFIERLYGLGAVEVVVVDIQRNGGFESTDSLVVTLPEQKPLRDAVFAFANDHTIPMGLEAKSDSGQPHFFIWFD